MASARRLATAGRTLFTHHSTQLSSLSSAVRFASNFPRDTPSPPRLPPEQQAEFERLQRSAFQRLVAQPAPSEATTNQSSATSESASGSNASAAQMQSRGAEQDDDTIVAGGVWRGARPEFEGDTNPKTGEVGGPKVEPLRWGDKGDWSYNGRVTDF
jgi:hypothetical protein